MQNFIDCLERRALFAAASTVVINGQKFKGFMEDGFQVVIPTKMPKTSPKLLTSGTFSSSSSIKKLSAASLAASTASPTGFQITLNLTGSGVSSAVQSAFSTAVAKWEAIITADIPDANGIDDIQIDASIAPIDGVGKILGQAGPSAVRTSSYIPIKGVMQFDSADLASLASSGRLGDVIFHEMGHVLGIGTIWSYKNLKGGTASDPRYVGSSAISAYKTLGGSEASIPLENTGGSGTFGAHWRESIFSNEVMTGYLNSGVNPISIISIASMIDLGYSVDLSQAENYLIPGVTPTGSIPQLSGKISGTLFNDANNNGTQDSGESPLLGKVVYLDTNNNGRPDTGERYVTSGDDGSYAFANLAAGTYYVKTVLASGFTQTASTAAITLASGDETTANIGTFDANVTIRGIAFLDSNNNGVKDSGETPASKFVVYLDVNNNGLYDRADRATITGIDGSYSFTNLKAGDHRLRIVLSGVGLSQTTPTSVLSLAAGATVNDAHVGYFDTKGSITGIAFVDANNNGVKNDGETPLVRQTVIMDKNANGKLDRGEAAVLTSSDGTYRFSGILPGTYVPTLVLVTGIVQTTPVSIDLAAAQNVTGANLGAYDTRGSIAGTVFNDANNNGTKDDGESALARATVYLDINSNSKYDRGEPAVLSGTDGSYKFANLQTGTYSARLNLTTGVMQANVATVTLSAAESKTGVNLGAYDTRGSISGIVFSDLNNNGVKDAGEPATAKASVYLDINGNSKYDRGEPLTLTAADGSYKFSNLLTNSYQPRLILGTSVIQTSTTSLVEVEEAQNLTDQNLGYFDTACTVSGSVYNDANQNGTRDSGETPSANRIVYFDANNNGVFDKGERSTTTNASGEYSFTSVTAGNYALRVSLPTGVNQTSPAQNAALGIALTPGQKLTGQAFGIYDTTGTIVGSVFFDTNRNGRQDTGEKPLPKYTIYLDTNNNLARDTTERSAVTASNGVYAFAGVPAGAYNIRIVVPLNQVQSLPSAGTPRTVTVSPGQTTTALAFGISLASTVPSSSQVSFIDSPVGTELSPDRADLFSSEPIL